MKILFDTVGLMTNKFIQMMFGGMEMEKRKIVEMKFNHFL